MIAEMPSRWYGPFAVALAELLLLTAILPVIVGIAAGYPAISILALIGATLIVEYGAAPAGLGLGLSPPYVLFTLCSVALGVTLFLFSAIDGLGDLSGRVRSFLDRSADRGRRSRILAKYGIFGLIPCVMVLGFYVCPPVSSVFGWNRNISILMIMAGFACISLVTILITRGIFAAFPSVGGV